MTHTAQPPPMPSEPRWRQSLAFYRDPWAYLARKRRELGDLFMLDVVGLGRWAYVCAPDLLKEMYRTPDTKLAAGQGTKQLIGDLLGEHGSSSVDGEAYLVRRRAITAQLKGLEASIPLMRSTVEKRIAGWDTEKPFAFLPEANRMSVEILLDTVLGDVDPEMLADFADKTMGFLDRLGSPFVLTSLFRRSLGGLTPWGRFLAARRRLQRAIGEEARRRKRTGDRPGGLIDALIEIDFPDAEPGEDPVQPVVDEVVNLLFAGRETTAKILTWILRELLLDEGCRRRLVEEIDDALGGRPIEDERALRRMPYLAAVVQEGLRYPPLGVFAGVRKALTEVELGGIRIPEGVTVAHCIAEARRREEVFPHPDTFDPRNFFERSLPRHAWNPFGGGIRICPGRDHGQLSLAVSLVTLLQRTELSLDSPERDRRIERSGMLHVPVGGLRLRYRPRRDGAAPQPAEEPAQKLTT